MNCLLNRRNTIALFLSVFTALAWLPPAHAAPPPQYTLNCSDCHGNNASDIRPIDSNVTFRNVTTGAFAGNHQTHMTATTDKSVCVKCHGAGVSAYVTGHMDGQVQANANVNNSPATGQYASTRAAFPNWSSNQAPLGTCSNVNCHFETVTPAWGSASFAYPADCNRCHGVAPVTGSHGTHTTYFSGVTQCRKCHADHTASANKFAHATSAGKRNLIVQLSDPADTAGGSYSGAVNDFLPSQANAFGDCTNLYCHSQGKSDSAFGGANAPKSTATWGGALAADCAGCHGGTEASTDDIATNKHAEHINQATAVGRKIGCQECHNATTSDGGTIASTANHVNKSVNIKFTGINGSTATYDGNPTNAGAGAAKTPGAALGAGCATLYCHSDGHPVADSRTYRTLAWNGAAIGCDGCHGDQAGISHPVHANAGVGIAGSNSHDKHVSSYAIGCVKCHSGTLTNNTTLIDNGAHLSGASNVANTDIKFDAFNPGGAYTAASQTCATTYCHSDSRGGGPGQAARWGDSMPGTCSGCHGGNAGSGSPMATNKHASHINNATAVGKNIGCAECHAATASNDTTIGTVANHVEKNVNIKFDNSVNLNSDAPTYDGAASTGASGAAKAAGGALGAGCANVYCHSSGNTLGGATPTFRTIAWNAVAIDCDGCHGDQAGKAHPAYVNGGTGTATANSHVKHVETSGLSCDYCHVGTTTDTAIPPTTVVNGGTHLNRTENVGFKSISGKTGTFNGDRTCSTTYCHGTGPSPAWGGATNCDSCHDADNSGDLSGATADPKSGHALHYNSASRPSAITDADAHTATTYVFSCQSCHPSNQHAAGPADASGPVLQDAAIGGTRLTSGNYTQAGASATDARGFNYTNGTCSTVCHTSDGATLGSAVGGNPAWSGTKTSPNCGVCHNKAGDAGPTWSAPHTKHVNTYSANANLTCNACHSGTASDNSTINGAAGRNQHPNQTRNVAFNAFAGGTWSGTQCQNTYCHSNGTSTAAPSHPLISWSGNTACTSCHGGTAAGPGYGNGTPKANSHAKHVVTMGYGCNACHNSTTTDGTSITTTANHVNKAYNVAAGGGNSFTLDNTPNPTTAAQCSNISCHGGSNATWGGSGPTCKDCHGGTSDTDNFGANFWSDGTRSQLKLAGEWDTTGHGRPAASGTYPKSANPAANFTGVNECAYCHDAGINHKTAANLFRLTNYSTQAYGRNAPCLVCHGRAAAGYLGKSVAQTRISSAHYGSKHTGTPGGGYFCWDCHDPHGDGNIYMVHDSVAVTSERSTGKPLTTAAVSFTDNATGTDYAKSSGPFNGICNVCHTSAGHYTAAAGDNHNENTRCMECHSHNGTTALAAFKQNGNCDSCHGYPPVRRDLVAGTDFRKQNQYSSGRFQDYTGGGGAHTIAKHLAPTVKASDGWAPCAVCHSNGNLNPGTHDMTTPVRPNGNITIDVKDSRKFDYRRSLGQERYTGAKLTNDKATNMTGSCSNVNCHFKPSKRWSNSR